MTIWIICLPLAFLLFATMFFLAHRISPLGRSIIMNSKTRIGIYGLISISTLSFALLFTDLLSDLPVGAVMAFLFVASMVSVLSAEGSYFLSKQQKWNKLFVGISGVVGILFMELALVSGIIAALPPGTIS